MPTKKPAHRPAGSKNKKRDHAETAKTTCPRCGSTDRTPYKGVPVQRAVAVSIGGNTYNTRTTRRTCCLSCGQYRFDHELANTEAPAP